ncbi:MAG: HAD family phosphatase [Hymenobacter sp.]
MIRTVIFDMDGVIIDTEPIHHQAFLTHFAELGIDVPKAEYDSYLGSSTRNVFQQLKQEYGLTADVESLLLRKRALFNEIFDHDPQLDLLPGVRGLIEDLRAHDVPLVLASSASKATIARVFSRFGLGPYFAHVVSGEDFVRSKPDPAIFRHAGSAGRNARHGVHRHRGLGQRRGRRQSGRHLLHRLRQPAFAGPRPTPRRPRNPRLLGTDGGRYSGHCGGVGGR